MGRSKATRECVRKNPPQYKLGDTAEFGDTDDSAKDRVDDGESSTDSDGDSKDEWSPSKDESTTAGRKVRSKVHRRRTSTSAGKEMRGTYDEDVDKEERAMDKEGQGYVDEEEEEEEEEEQEVEEEEGWQGAMDEESEGYFDEEEEEMKENLREGVRNIIGLGITRVTPRMGFPMGRLDDPRELELDFFKSLHGMDFGKWYQHGGPRRVPTDSKRIQNPFAVFRNGEDVSRVIV
jgi:hypothetical protein